MAIIKILIILVLSCMISSCKKKNNSLLYQAHTNDPVLINILHINKDGKPNADTIAEIARDISIRNFSELKKLSKSQRLEFMRLLVGEMSNAHNASDDVFNMSSGVQADIYRILTGMQGACLPPYKSNWEEWIDDKINGNSVEVDWLF